MARTKITQNINKDAGLLDLPKVVVPTSKWLGRHSNYISANTGDIVPIYCEEVMPKERKKITMGMISHMTTPQAPIFNAFYNELRVFFVSHRNSSDLLDGYNSRKSPWVKVFGEPNEKASANIVVPISNQKLPAVTNVLAYNETTISFKAFGGLYDALDMEPSPDVSDYDSKRDWFKSLNHLSIAAYELIYQYCYRNQNRESPTESLLYRFLLNAYNKTTINSSDVFDDAFHTASREKDYFTGSAPFTQKGDPVTVGLLGEAPVIFDDTDSSVTVSNKTPTFQNINITAGKPEGYDNDNKVYAFYQAGNPPLQLLADLSQSSGVSIEQLRIMLKLQEALEKDMMYGSDYASYLNSRFGVRVVSTLLEEPKELNKINITSEMQAIFQTSVTSGEASILGTIGANATTTARDIEILPETYFDDWGYVIICAVHKTQNVYDAAYFKPKHLFKFARFDYFAKEIEDLGFQPVSGLEMNYATNGKSAVSFNESFAEYRYNFNKCHGFLEPSRANAFDFWTTALSDYDDIQSLYKQGKDEVDRVISVTSLNAPQFYDAYGFIEICEKPMKLHSIPGFDGVI